MAEEINEKEKKMTDLDKADDYPKYNEETLKKLEEVLKLDVTIELACSHAGIVKDTYYRWYREFDDFAKKMDAARNFARITAGNVVKEAIERKKDVNTAKWWLEKKHSNEFGGAEDKKGNTFNIMGDLNLENVVNLSTDERERRIAEAEARLATIEGSQGNGDSQE